MTNRSQKPGHELRFVIFIGHWSFPKSLPARPSSPSRYPVWALRIRLPVQVSRRVLDAGVGVERDVGLAVGLVDGGHRVWPAARKDGFCGEADAVALLPESAVDDELPGLLHSPAPRMARFIAGARNVVHEALARAGSFVRVRAHAADGAVEVVNRFDPGDARQDGLGAASVAGIAVRLDAADGDAHVGLHEMPVDLDPVAARSPPQVS